MPHPARLTVTLREVAAAAGVSVATASRVLGGSARTVSAANARKVLEAASELRYTADVAARAMRRKSDSIALVADDLTTPSIAQVVAAMERQARTVDAFVTVSAAGGDPRRQLETVRTVCAFRPRALVITSSWAATTAYGARLAEELHSYERRGGRVVIYGDMDAPFDAIGVDDRGSARLMGAHLAATGHRRIAILAGTRERTFAAARTTGFLEGLLGGGVDVRDIRVIDCPVSRAGGYAAASRLLDESPGEFDALMAVNDMIAVGALSACRAAGVDVPGRLSVTGFDDIPLAADVTPRLTTVSLPFAEIGERSIRLALTVAGRPDRPGIRQTVTGRLVVRQSSKVI
ncbi:LacI family transcriptional regulator [Actinoplanes lobatus]|uniref:LacI family transcriptional regulator n=1 Tax=Actinoplanes lobatus TaxID=113568 RepID=A0A7W7HM04_9ACTN|nr:LacI family DNA-binding transcriptional regulator [Actinoplanes lobatus]MBB4752707.1 LacI family transcriptional regulator [Actinoplanes lobatus]GGN90631.1 LacI family transcriptional regulator [Actinoplanes lobatus]GIE43955.1 LacI family transcriptional regulator [Actinoplanes lobatus]